jgi:hypothetical protein
MKLLYTFTTVSAALEAEQAFKKARLPCRVVPTPRALGASCNYAIILETEDAEEGGVLGGNGVEYAKVFRCVEGAGKESYLELGPPL